MIVAPLFEGDDDGEVAWKQHDVYGHALAVTKRNAGHPDLQMRYQRRMPTCSTHSKRSDRA